MIKTTYNPNLEKYRQAEVNYIKTHSAASSEQSHHNNNEGFSPLGMYALIQQTAGNLDSTLEDMLEKARACKDSDIGKFVQEHSASIVRKVREHDAANKRSDFLKHYKLVNKIGGNDLE